MAVRSRGDVVARGERGSAADNAAANGVGDRVLAVAAEAWRGDGGFDVVVANILANTLVALAPTLAAALRAGGRIALSGVLPEQGDEVAACYAGHGIRLERGERDGWLLLHGRRD